MAFQLLARRNTKQAAYALMVAGYFILGMMVLTVSTLIKTLIPAFSWSDSQGGLLMTCLSLGNLATSLGNHLVVRQLGRSRAMLLYSLLIVAAFLLAVISPWPVLFFPLMLIAGFSWGGINAMVNTVVSDLYPGNTARLNVTHAGFGVGAVLSSLLVGVLISGGASWRIPMVLVAAAAGLLALGCLMTELPERQVITHTSGTPMQEIPFLNEFRFYMGTLAFFLYVGVESGANAWLSPWLSQVNALFREIPSETMVSLMWLTIIVGRLGFASLGGRLHKQRLLILLSCGFLLGMIGISYFSQSTPVAILSVAFMGLSMSAMYATLVANNTRYMVRSAAAPGILFAGGGLGSAVIPFLAGAVSDRHGMQWGMGSLVCFLLLLAALAVLNRMVPEVEDEK